MSDQDAQGSDDLDPDEPRTPWWMPLLGGFLFLMAALFALIAADGAPEEGEEGTADEPAGALEAPGTRGGHDHPRGDHAGHDHPGHNHPGHNQPGHGHDH